MVCWVQKCIGATVHRMQRYVGRCRGEDTNVYR